MKRWLYLIHRWAGIALALFMLIWFTSGLIIMYSGSSALSPVEQLRFRSAVVPQSAWLSLGDAWQISADQRAQLPVPVPATGAKPPSVDGETDWIQSARLLSLAGAGYWLVENGLGQRFALSALTGNVHAFNADDAKAIAAEWLAQEQLFAGDISMDTSSESASLSVSTSASTELAHLHHLDTGPQDSSVRNYDALRPFHRIGVGDSSRELLISARTGELVRDSTRLDRALFWAGNWIHLLRAVEASISADARRNTLLWLATFAFVAGVTGIIIGWQRWRPGWFGRKTYGQGRVHPYRDVWNTWHFWVGLIGGFAAIFWAFSGLMNTNPRQLFAPANPTKPELSRYQGVTTPAQLLAWKPGSSDSAEHNNKSLVELSWQRVGDSATLVGVTRDGQRIAQTIADAPAAINEAILLAAASRFANGTPVASSQLQTEYDSYYYPRHHQTLADKPLPVLWVDLADDAGTQLYLDPQDGRILLKQDTSRRVYRWVYSALHHWDFGWLYHRPLWDAWMLPLVLMGMVLGFTSVVLGWKRLQMEFKPKKKKRKTKKPARKPVLPPVAPDSAAS